MKKAREFYVLNGVAREENNWLYYKHEPKPEPIHVREIVPLDWEKIWQHPFMVVLSPRLKKLIQELVEKSLRGEL